MVIFILPLVYLKNSFTTWDISGISLKYLKTQIFLYEDYLIDIGHIRSDNTVVTVTQAIN